MKDLAARQEKMRRRHGATIAKAPGLVPATVHDLPVELDKHYTTQQVADMWGVGFRCVQSEFPERFNSGMIDSTRLFPVLANSFATWSSNRAPRTTAFTGPRGFLLFLFK